MVEPFEAAWQHHFPTRPEWRTPSWPIPNPHTIEFIQGYGESLWEFVEAASNLRGWLQNIALHTPKRRSRSEMQRQAIGLPLAKLTTMSGPANLSVELNDEGDIAASFDSPSLLSAYTAMAMLDLSWGYQVVMCKRQRCRTPFIYPDPRTEFCSTRCRRAFEKAERRERERSMKK